MFLNIVTKKPLLFILSAIALGILVGSYCFVFLSPSLVLLALAAFLVLSRFLSSLCLFPASFLLGVLLVGNSIQRGSEPTVTIPLIEQAEEYMDRQREHLLLTFQAAGMTADEYGIVAAVTLGERSAVSSELRESYRISGASHLFALSGLHLSIIFAFLSAFLPTRVFPKSSAVVQILLLWTYVMLVGIHPSLLRAAVMFTCYCLCRIVSRDAHNTDVLILTALILLAVGCSSLLSRLVRTDARQRRTVVIEVGMQNAAQAIAIASSPIIFANEQMAIPAILYSLMMNIVLLIYVGLVRRRG